MTTLFDILRMPEHQEFGGGFRKALTRSVGLFAFAMWFVVATDTNADAQRPPVRRPQGSAAASPRTVQPQQSRAAREIARMESIDKVLAADVNLEFLRSVAADRRDGTPLEHWLDSTLASCERLGCGTAVTMPMNPITLTRLQVARFTCLQPARLVKSQCRTLLEIGSKNSGTTSLAVRAAHRLLTASLFGQDSMPESLAMLRQYASPLASAPAVTRAQLWQRAALVAGDNTADFVHFRDLLSGALTEVRAPSAVVAQAQGASTVDELSMSSASQALKRKAASARTQRFSVDVPPGSSAERVLAARGLAIDQILMLEQTLSSLDAVSFRWIKWLFTPAGAIGERNSNAPGSASRRNERGSAEGTETDTNTVNAKAMMYPVAARFTRLATELMSVSLIRAMSRDNAIELLDFQAALFMRYILMRCGSETACITGLSEMVRSSKGMLAIAYGTTIPSSRFLLFDLTPEEEGRGIRVVESMLRNSTQQARIDSTSLSPYGAFFRDVASRQSSRPDAAFNLERSALADNELFIDVFRATPFTPAQRRTLYAIVSMGNQPKGFVELGPESELSEKIDRWRAVANSDSIAAWDRESAQLAEIVWGKLKPHIPASAARIFIAPDSRLQQVNLSLLAELAGVSVDVGVVPSFAHLIALRRSDAKPNARGAFLMTDVRFGAGTTFAPIEFRPSVAPGLKAAGAAVDSAWGDDVNWQRVKDGLQKSSIGILVTHGAVPLGDEDSLSTYLTRSTFALSKANTTAGARVSAAQFAQLDLRRTALTMLIACRLGDGEILDGQGVLGFPLALTAAGAQASVVSLWPADNDKTTGLFVEAFVDAAVTRRLPFQRALREARDAVRKQYPQAPASTWAGWTVIGNPFGRLQ